MYIVIQDSSSHNTIYLTNIMVDDNKSKDNSGGGGVDLGFNIATTLYRSKGAVSNVILQCLEEE